MDTLEALSQAGGAEAVARDLGIDPATAQSGIAALLPAVLGGLQDQAQANPQGIAGLSDILGGLGGGDLLSQVLGQQPTDVSQGNEVLGQIFGSKDTSRTVAAQASDQTGISSDLLKKMLPMVAMMAAGYFMNKKAQGDEGAGGLLGGAAGGILDSILGGSGGQANPLNTILEGLTRR